MKIKKHNALNDPDEGRNSLMRVRKISNKAKGKNLILVIVVNTFLFLSYALIALVIDFGILCEIVESGIIFTLLDKERLTLPILTIVTSF